MGLAVTGIAPGVDTTAIEQALRGANLSLEPLSVLSAEEGVEGVADSGIRFIYTGSDAARSFLASGTAGITSMGGVDVPGMGGTGGIGGTSGTEYFRPETLSDELGDLEIPDSEIGNYLEAIEAGRSVFVYYAQPDNREQVEGIFKQLGFANVQTF